MLHEIQNASALLYLSGASGADRGLRGIWPVYSTVGMASGWALTFRQCRLSYVFWATVALLLLTCLLHWGEVKQDLRRLTDSLLHAEDKAREARRETPTPAEEANTTK